MSKKRTILRTGKKFKGVFLPGRFCGTIILAKVSAALFVWEGASGRGVLQYHLIFHANFDKRGDMLSRSQRSHVNGHCDAAAGPEARGIAEWSINGAPLADFYAPHVLSAQSPTFQGCCAKRRRTEGTKLAEVPTRAHNASDFDLSCVRISALRTFAAAVKAEHTEKRERPRAGHDIRSKNRIERIDADNRVPTSPGRDSFSAEVAASAPWYIIASWKDIKLGY